MLAPVGIYMGITIPLPFKFQMAHHLWIALHINLLSLLLRKHADDQSSARPRPPPLTPELRKAFVTSLMRFIDRAQYSKSAHMVGQAASAAMGLAYVEPTIVLPLAIARFQQAVETVRGALHHWLVPFLQHGGLWLSERFLAAQEGPQVR